MSGDTATEMITKRSRACKRCFPLYVSRVVQTHTIQLMVAEAAENLIEPIFLYAVVTGSAAGCISDNLDIGPSIVTLIFTPEQDGQRTIDVAYNPIWFDFWNFRE